MALLGFQSTHYDQDRVLLNEAEIHAHLPSRAGWRSKCSEITTVSNDADLSCGESFLADQIASISFRYRNVIVHEATCNPVNKKVRFQQALAPVFAHMRRFHNHRNSTQSSHRRRSETAAKHVGVQYIRSVTAKKARQTKAA